jgi:molybdopterin-guanine dinucleotide biosynthesis protein A
MCGGKSSRMRQEIGADKTTLPLGNSPTLVEYQISKFYKIFETIFLSSKEPKFGASYDYIFDVDTVCGVDTSELFAPALSFYSALLKTRQSTLFIPADMPLLEISTLDSIISLASDETDAVVLRVDGKPYPTCAIYSPNILPVLEKMIVENRHKLQQFLLEIGTIYADFESRVEFTNINAYSDYQEIQKS